MSKMLNIIYQDTVTELNVIQGAALKKRISRTVPNSILADYRLDEPSICTPLMVIDTGKNTSHGPAASILHAIGRPKFWDGLHNEVWDKRYKKWIEAGGSPYHEPLKRRLVRYTYEASIRNMLRKMLSKSFNSHRPDNYHPRKQFPIPDDPL